MPEKEPKEEGVGLNMSAWLSANLSTILISLVILLVVVLIIVKLVKDRKSGKRSCGCDCAHCAMAGSCHGGSMKQKTPQSFSGQN